MYTAKGVWQLQTSALSTTNVDEGTNLYFTNTRARAAFTAGNRIILDANGLITANVTGGGASVSIANTSPLTGTSGDLYWDNDLGKLFIYYSSQWVEASPMQTASAYSFSKAVGGTATALYSFSKTSFRGGKFTITLSDSTNYKIEELLVVHDGTNVSITNKYMSDDAVVIGSVAVTYTANIVGSNVVLYAAAATGSPTAKGDVILVEV